MTHILIKTHLGKGGRIVIPSECRRELGVAPGDEVLLQVAEGELRILSLKEAIRRSQAVLRRHVAEGRSLVDELIGERRKEAERE